MYRRTISKKMANTEHTQKAPCHPSDEKMANTEHTQKARCHPSDEKMANTEHTQKARCHPSDEKMANTEHTQKAPCHPSDEKMANTEHTQKAPCHPSDEKLDTSYFPGLESSALVTTELVCAVPQSQNYNPLQEDCTQEDDTPTKVCDGVMAGKVHRTKSTDIPQSTEDVPQNQTKHTVFNLELYCVVFGNVVNLKMFIISWFLISLNTVSANQICNRVLTASDVGANANKNIDLSHENIKDIDKSAFANSEAVERLNLSGNCLENVPNEVFVNMTNVFSMDMAWNGFLTYPFAFRNPETLKTLMELNFMGNVIDHLGKNYFKGKEMISVLNFSKNLIDSVHDCALNPLAALMIIDFSKNMMTHPPRFNVTNLKNLNLMDLRNNSLEFLNIPWFSNFPQVSNISVTDEYMTLVRNDVQNSVEFWITGNSESLSCELLKNEIEQSKVSIEYSFSCQGENGTAQVLRGSTLPQGNSKAAALVLTTMSTTLPVSDDIAGSYHNSQNKSTSILEWVFGVLVLLLSIGLLVVVVWSCIQFRHYKKVIKNLEEVSRKTGATNKEPFLEVTESET